MSLDEIEMYVVNGSEITLDDSLLNDTVQLNSVNNKRLLLSAYRPSREDDVGLSTCHIYFCYRHAGAFIYPTHWL